MQVVVTSQQKDTAVKPKCMKFFQKVYDMTQVGLEDHIYKLRHVNSLGGKYIATEHSLEILYHF